MKILIQQFGYCWLVCILILVFQDGCGARAPVGLHIDRKDLSVASHDRGSHHHHLEPEIEDTPLFQTLESKTEKETKITIDDSVDGGSELQNEDNGDGDLEEGIEERDLVEHIDYAGATTHPPIEPPKKSKPTSSKESVPSPARSDRK